MQGQKLYLKPNVIVEPLFDQWYAWTHLISPATAAMNIAYRHLTIMKSYIHAPHIHASAVKDPTLLGGPFMDYERNRANEITDLMEKTSKERAHMIALAEDIKTLDQMLMSEAEGYSLEPLYLKVPESLKGYTELVYDLNNTPSFRLIESLLYNTPYYNPSSQSLALSLTDDDTDRPFVLSTPRLQDDRNLHLNIPFNHEGIDALFRMKKHPQSLNDIKDKLNFEGKREDLFSSFFTEEQPNEYSKYTGDGIRTRYFGHASILVETQKISILIDPVISYDYINHIPRYTYSDLPDVIDYVLLTHNHQDHVLLETLLQLRHKIGQAVIIPRNGSGFLQDPSLKLALQNIGFKAVIEIDEMETIEIDGGTILGLPFLGEHCDLNIRSKTAYLVCLENKTLLLAADSCNVEAKLYEHIHELIGDVDILFLGMECDGAPLSWVYGPLLTNPLERRMDHSRRLSGSNYERAVDIVNRFHCKEVYVYAMGMEPWLKYIMTKAYTEESDPIIASNRLIEDCRDRGIVAERLFGEKEILK